ncbi:hypothetical protein [Erwinia typographi]|uniref:hypothetical protein n=1 Tax=Erwinia typographi TaxID=371042 RepID=UPI001E342AAD|nr:hypothetical protein [Erwinia typographi]
MSAPGVFLRKSVSKVVAEKGLSPVVSLAVVVIGISVKIIMLLSSDSDGRLVQFPLISQG